MRDYRTHGRVLARKGGAAVAEQLIYSGSNFALSLYLARALPLRAFGLFGLAYGSLLVMSSLYNALILEPATVLGPARDAARAAEYVRRLTGAHLLLLAPIAGTGGLLLSVAGLAGWESPLVFALGMAAVIAPAILLHWLARRICYINARPSRAIPSNGLYALILGGGTWWLRYVGLLDARSVLVLMAIASIAGAVPILAKERSWVMRGSAGLLKDHWRYGHWILWSSVLGSLDNQSYAYLTAGILTVSAAGTIRAALNAALPISQLMVAASSLALPSLARAFGSRDPYGLRRRARTVAMVCAVAAGLNALVVALVHPTINRYVYADKFSARESALMAIIAVHPILGAIGLYPSLVLRSVQHPRHYLAATLISAPLGIGGSYGLTAFFGITGAAWSFAWTSGASALSHWLVFLSWTRRSAWWSGVTGPPLETPVAKSPPTRPA